MISSDVVAGKESLRNEDLDAVLAGHEKRVDVFEPVEFGLIDFRQRRFVVRRQLNRLVRESRVEVLQITFTLETKESVSDATASPKRQHISFFFPKAFIFPSKAINSQSTRNIQKLHDTCHRRTCSASLPLVAVCTVAIFAWPPAAPSRRLERKMTSSWPEL